MYNQNKILHTNGMIILLLVCIFLGINLRVYLNFDKMQSVIQVILPFNLTFITLRLNLINKTLFYKINKSKDKQIVLPNSKKTAKREFKKISIYSLNYSIILGSSNDCVKGLYISQLIEYATNFILNTNKFVEIEHLNKLIMPNFKDTSTKLVLNIVVRKGIIDIIKNVFSKKAKKENEVEYAN